MSVKIKVSYQRPEELRRILERLGPEVMTCRRAKNQEGKFLKAYIEMVETVPNSERTARTGDTNKRKRH